jgi:hypothetical protein
MKKCEPTEATHVSMTDSRVQDEREIKLKLSPTSTHYPPSNRNQCAVLGVRGCQQLALIILCKDMILEHEEDCIVNDG